MGSATFNYTYSPHLAPYSVPLSEFRAQRPELNHYVNGAHIFSTTSSADSQPRVLLIQRSMSDCFGGGIWEGAGGSCEDTDATLLEGTAREVLEETGLHVSRFVDLVSVDGWVLVRTGEVRRVAKYTFLVEVHEQSEGQGWEQRVKLDEKEHQAFVWVTEGEVLEGIVEKKYTFMAEQAKNLRAAFELFRIEKGISS